MTLSIVPPATPPKPPKHLSAEAAQWWRSVLENYQLEEHHIKLLEAACMAWTRMEQARKAIAQDGLTFTDARGCIKAHPAVAIERDSRIAFARMLRELQLDDAMAADWRPPALASNRSPRGH